ncbi:hypothetical protein NQ314_017331 [Rhamnusium bicolor]|uniref:DUF3730 domain-containing protein n=1 Tax=Rhamnusium bicolor TaxID=1586634 RepID=A0AAV8WUU1_9CUCU|nr:hypothetical protein NQ314_017331 [Rhamnusium bicolor]
MEEIESKLNSNNPIVIAQIFSKIVQNIKEKHKIITKESPELKFLKDKCLIPDPLISEVAGRGIINLVEDGVLQIETILTDFITTIPLTKCYSSLTNILGSLLYLEVKNKLSINKEYKNSYNLWSPQHPFIMMLIENSDTWKCIFNEIRIQYTNENGEYVTELLKPVYLYALCNPVQKDVLYLFKQRMFTFLLHNDNLDSTIFYNILCWMQLETRHNLEANSDFLNDTLFYIISTNQSSLNLEVFILWQVSVLYHLALNKLDIRPCIHCLNTVFKETNDLVTINCLLLMFSKTIEICSSVYLLDLLNLCKVLLSYDGKEIYILQAVKASLLQWLASPSILTTDAVKVANIIFTYIENYKSSSLINESLENFSVQFQTIINANNSKLHFALLKALPKMVVLRENMPKVMATLQALSNGSVDLYTFSLSLMYDAWNVDHKCYSYLENMLIQNKFTAKNWETYVTKTYIIRELCLKKPELYGKDMVAHLSKVLNDCNNDDGALPCALAIEGITILCRAEIIDVITTWAKLSPKYKTDTRIPVIKSLCSLIHEIPYLLYTESYTELRAEVVKALWEYVNVGDPQITEAALNSITSFSLEEICSQLLVNYLDEDVIEERKKSVVGTPLTVPGKTWIKFLKENGSSKEAVNFLIKMISIEVSGYLKYVYQEYSKPLPPLDWCFLQELFHDQRTKHYCIDIASHQAILSGTARRLVENYIIAVNENPQENDIISVFRNLNHLANSIQPVILKPFFEKAIGFAINKYNNEYKDTLLVKILDYLRDVLQNKDIQETNKTTIFEVLNDKISITATKSQLFDILLPCVITLPKKYIEEMTTLKQDVSEDWLEKVTKVRCTIALHTNIKPLTWLNEIIEVSSTIERNRFTLKEFIKVFRKHINNTSECALWLLELICQIQAKVADRCAEKEVLYFFDVFILTVVEFSGYSTFLTDQSGDCDRRTKDLFPQAFQALMKVNDWSVCTTQALEWLYYMNSEETVPNEYRNIFGMTLQSMRHDDEFIKKSRWMKYLSCQVFQ